MTENKIDTKILDCCFKIFKEFGNRLYESAHEVIFTHELKQLSYLLSVNLGEVLLKNRVTRLLNDY